MLLRCLMSTFYPMSWSPWPDYMYHSAPCFPSCWGAVLHHKSSMAVVHHGWHSSAQRGSMRHPNYKSHMARLWHFWIFFFQVSAQSFQFANVHFFSKKVNILYRQETFLGEKLFSWKLNFPLKNSLDGNFPTSPSITLLK